MAQRGRPKGTKAPNINVSPEDVTRWAKTGATQPDIAAKLGVSLATLERRLTQPKFRQALLVGKGELCISLRAKQVQVALSGNVQMLKWLGEQYLDQARNHRLSGPGGMPIEVANVSPAELLARRIDSLASRLEAKHGPSGSQQRTD